MEKAGVDVRLGTEVTPELACEIAPDALIVAAGSDPLVPAIEGIENAVMADDLPDMGGKLGQKVVIIGGGLVGCETAVHLAMDGRDVTVVEMLGDLCTDANLRHRPLLMVELKKSVTCLTNTTAVRLTGDGLVCLADEVETLIPADTVICATGRVPNRYVIESLANCAPYVDAIGDCVKPSNVAQAVFRGHYAALDI